MANGIRIPKRQSLEKILEGVMNRECSCIMLNDPESFRNQVLNLAGMKFDGQYEVINEVAKIVKSAESTEQSCFYYIIIVELVRQLIIPKHGTPKGEFEEKVVKTFIDKSKDSIRTKLAELFIAKMDSVITFQR